LRLAVLDQDLGRFVPQTPEELSQLRRRHGQHVGLTRVLLAPADVQQEPEVFGDRVGIDLSDLVLHQALPQGRFLADFEVSQKRENPLDKRVFVL
jgi:hypothetical protein